MTLNYVKTDVKIRETTLPCLEVDMRQSADPPSRAPGQSNPWAQPTQSDPEGTCRAEAEGDN